jgi:hypothetical protein
VETVTPSASTETEQTIVNKDAIVNENIANTSSAPHNIYTYNGDEWDVFKQRLPHELTSRPAWQNPQSVFDDNSISQLSTHSINYADAMPDGSPLSTHYSTSELFT